MAAPLLRAKGNTAWDMMAAHCPCTPMDSHLAFTSFSPDIKTQAQLNTVQPAPCWRRMTGRGPTVRPLALSVFTCINVVLCWLWWQGIQVERHDLPDPCSYLQAEGQPLLVSRPNSAGAHGLQSDRSEKLATPGSLLKNCAISGAALAHLERWQSQLHNPSSGRDGKGPPSNATPPGDLPSCPSTSSSHGELLQWLTALRVVPLCPDALPAARQVYRHLASVGETDTTPSPTYTACTAIPVASVLEAAGREAPAVSGSANVLLAVSLLPPPQQAAACTADAKALRAALRHTDEQAVADGAPEGLNTLHIFVTTQRSEEAVPRLHIGAGSSLLLVVPISSSNSNSSKEDASGSEQSGAALLQVAAEATAQALGRWVLSPQRGDAAISGDLRLRLWLLGDTDKGNDGAAYPDDQEEEGGSMRDGVRDPRGASGSDAWGQPKWAVGPSAPSRLTWDGGLFLRMHLRGFLEAVSSLLDLQITSQVVPDSGLEQVEWDLLRRGLGIGGRAEEAFQEETVRRLLNLQEQWGSDPDYSPSASSVNLTVYRPSSPTDAWPPGSALALPSWGFITFGMPLPQLEFDPQGISDLSPQRLQEAAVVSGAWIAQLRFLLGLQATPELQQKNPAAPSCRPLADSSLCGEDCRAQRCGWRVETADAASAPYDIVLLQQEDASGGVFSDTDFALAPSRAVLVGDGGSSSRRVDVYLHPSSRGLTGWEFGGLAAEEHFKMITEAANNIQKLHTVLRSGTDLRVTERVAHAMHQCRTLPEAAKEFLVGSDPGVCPMEVSDGSPLLAPFGPLTVRADCNVSKRPPLGKGAMYRQLALLLARAAVKDSKALLADETLEPAPFFSLHFNMAVHVPLLLPFVLPTIVSLIRAAKFALRK
ncbi:hypothetical protein, conserved [Eimeria praecox]|uniref:GPI transamidase component PIG-S n=1 Tax=Eimeria praecox TaxID=51316 RepID=U6H7D7_9EIME|nr:hypothetical protein, conserved [Eimeria praecox]